tara:strand:- start:49 stop:714 length:666 start_codon:yes stop_codon:yes gene_type:complete
MAINFYTRVKNHAEKLYVCDLPCKNVLRDEEYYFPRGIFYLGDSLPKLIVIGKNPGHMIKELSEKRSSYEEAVKFESICFKFKTGKNFVFHQRLLQYLEYLINSNYIDYQEAKRRREEITEDVFTKVYKTNFIKCSTPNEQESFSNLKTEISNCVDNYLKVELDYCQNPPILFLGNESYYEFHRQIPDYPNRVAKIKHPSYPYRKEDEETELENVKHELGL